MFSYDKGGNILERVEYMYTKVPTKELVGGNRFAYTYPSTGWRDQLMYYNGENFIYDSLGNPTTYRGKTLSWKYGRQLASFEGNTYNYNAEGIRISKTNANNITTHFYLDGTKILAQDNGNILSFKYGVDGVVGFTYEGVGEYFYKKNIFGDIIGILNSSGDEIAKYTYDAWGNHKTLVLNNNEYVDILSTISYTTEGSNNKFIAELNPFRYRGYYYDVETGLYYLNSRYYDPEIGRFINADDISYLDPESINGLNLYAYCINNPTNLSDESGCSWWDWLISGIEIIVGAVLVATGVGAGFGAMLIAGGTIGLISNAVGSAIGGGIGSVVNGGGAISTGISLFAYGPIGIIAGIGLIAIGAATAIMGTNEIARGITGHNYIQEWTGISDSLYSSLYLGFNIASSIGTIAASISMQAIATARLNAIIKNPQSVQNLSKFQFKTYAKYSNQWNLSLAKNGKGFRALNIINKGQSIRYGYGINNAEHFWGGYYWIVANGKKFRFPFI